eukprot:scaffold69413_cov15-Prasinocladus_malaysianus.AAC.1
MELPLLPMPWELSWPKYGTWGHYGRPVALLEEEVIHLQASAGAREPRVSMGWVSRSFISNAEAHRRQEQVIFNCQKFNMKFETLKRL